jgi:hypothetical protein
MNVTPYLLLSWDGTVRSQNTPLLLFPHSFFWVQPANNDASVVHEPVTHDDASAARVHAALEPEVRAPEVLAPRINTTANSGLPVPGNLGSVVFVRRRNEPPDA